MELAAAEGNGLAELHAESDEEGQYHSRGVHPGQFVIGVNLEGVPNAKSFYLRTCSPDAPKRQNASNVSLRKGEIVARQDIYLGRRAGAREVEGIVLWQDGKPAANATISLSYPDYPWHADSKPGPTAKGSSPSRYLGICGTYFGFRAKLSRGMVNAGEVELPTHGPIKAMTLVLSRQPQK